MKQIPLEFEHRPCLGREDFMVAKCNAEAVSMLDSWPNWNFFALCIYGPKGSGKTHLANVFSNKVSVFTNHPYKIPSIKAKDINLELPHHLFEKSKCLIVEDLEEVKDFEAMFHLYNLYRNEGGYILFTSLTAPARINVSLPDLRSRLNIIPAIEIKDPDDDMLSALTLKLFSDRQINISPDTLGYILKNTQRSYSYIRKLVAEIDTISLAQKRAVSIPIIKEAFANLNDNKQQELF